MDPMHYEDQGGRLSGLLILLEDRMEKHDAALIHQFIAAGEYALALEELAGFLAVAGTLITDQERGGMAVLAQRMQMDDNVPRTVAFCPRQIAAPAGP
jgi:hypothetical protein